MEDKRGKLHCNCCGAFVSPDWESNADHYHYCCNSCMSTGYIEVK